MTVTMATMRGGLPRFWAIVTVIVRVVHQAEDQAKIGPGPEVGQPAQTSAVKPAAMLRAASLSGPGRGTKTAAR
jgi:hypothetical protein